MIDPPDVDARIRRLRGPLLAELRPRRRRRPLVVALALIAAAVVIAIPRQPALAVERQDGWLVFTIEDATADPGELTRELRQAGVRGQVKMLPVPADRVGTWAVIAEHTGPDTGSEQTVRLDRVAYERETLRIPIADVRESSGSFVFYVGREARPGEDLWRDGDRRYRP